MEEMCMITQRKLWTYLSLCNKGVPGLSGMSGYPILRMVFWCNVKYIIEYTYPDTSDSPDPEKLLNFEKLKLGRG